MNKLMTKLLERRITRWSLPLAVITIVAASVAWSNQGHGQYQLGGGFMGSGGGMIWSAFQIPLDPAGRTAAVRVTAMTYGADLAGLFAMFGADTATETTGQAKMISRDTAEGSFMGYGVKQGNPPQICLIEVYTWTLKFMGPDDFVVNFTLDVYPGPANILGLPNADADGDGFPDPGTTPALSIPNGVGTAKRVSAR